MSPPVALATAVAAAVVATGCSSSRSSLPAWISSAQIAVPGNGVANHDCTSGICKHNENTDLTLFHGDIYLVHRTAESQMLGPNSSLNVYRYAAGAFTLVKRIPAPSDRDIRDPHFYVVGDELRIKALARLPSDLIRDSGVDTVALEVAALDASTNWSELGPHGWSFWRLKQAPTGEWLTAAYQDGDRSVVLYRSVDGVSFSAGATIYDDASQTPLETELTFFPSGRLLALVRTDGSDAEITGDAGVRTVVCWADPPYASIVCPQVLDGVRLDGPLTFFWHDRLFVIARKHLGADGRKRTALYELGGTLDGGTLDGGTLDGGGTLTIREWGELPSAGDTSYAGAAPLPDGRVLATWYSGDVASDDTWLLGMYAATDIWQATLDLGRLK
ncbi:MAG TPA: hypothetical protein VHB97_00015 [Polyangia bacterium]|nr:hypothetical protein [Polyangia bacterium]